MTFEMLMEERFEAGMEKGIKKGAYNKSLETAKKLLDMSLTLEKIAEATGLPLETVLELETKK